MTEYSSPDAAAFRHTIGLFATGVTVLTTQTDTGGWLGMTANAVSSVSLDPLLVLVCVGKTAAIAEPLLEAPGFTLNILSRGQENLSSYFAGLWQTSEPPAYTIHQWAYGPRLEGVIGALGCSRYEITEGGDHWIVLGKVEELYYQDSPAAPLLFFGGQYRTLTDHEDRA